MTERIFAGNMFPDNSFSSTFFERMEVGDSGWVEDSRITINSDGEAYISASGTVEEVNSYIRQCFIEKTEDGIIATIYRSGEHDDYDHAPSEPEGDFAPISKLTFVYLGQRRFLTYRGKIANPMYTFGM